MSETPEQTARCASFNGSEWCDLAFPHTGPHHSPKAGYWPIALRVSGDQLAGMLDQSPPVAAPPVGPTPYPVDGLDAEEGFSLDAPDSLAGTFVDEIQRLRVALETARRERDEARTEAQRLRDLIDGALAP